MIKYLLLSLAIFLSACAPPPITIPSFETINSRGPAPDREAALKAVDAVLQRELKDYDSMKNFKVVFGPEAMVATTLDGRFDEAWLVCVEYNAKNSYGAYAGISRLGVAMRVKPDGSPDVLRQVGWRFVTPSC